MDIVGFLLHWYHGGHYDPVPQKLERLNAILDQYPELEYRGKAWRLTEVTYGEDPHVEAPTSWSASYEGVSWYLNAGSVSDPEWTGLLVYGDLRGVNLGKLALIALKSGDVAEQDHVFLVDIIKADEVVSLEEPDNLEILNWVEDRQLLPW